MSQVVTTADLNDQLVACSRRLDELIQLLGERAFEAAQAEKDYRLERAKAWLQAGGRTAKEKEDSVNAITAGLRETRDLAIDMKRSVYEELDNERAKLSATQSVAAASREEMRMAGRYSEGA